MSNRERQELADAIEGNVYLDAARQLEAAAREVRRMVDTPDVGAPDSAGNIARVRKHLSIIHANIDAASARLHWSATEKA